MSLAHRPVKSWNKKQQANPKVPRWIQYFKYQQRKLHEILSFLYQVKPGPEFRTFTDEQFKDFGIQLFDLDLKTGETPPSVTRYFLPSDAPGISSDGSGSDPIDDGFMRYNKTNTKRIYRDVKWPEQLAGGFLGHAHKLKHNVFDPPWKQLMLNHNKRGELYHYSHAMEVKSGVEYGGGRFPHRTVLAVVDRETQEFRPSVPELMALVSWMLAAMYCQERAKMKKRRKDKTVKLHKTFPACFTHVPGHYYTMLYCILTEQTLVYTFMRPARARVLYGYFEKKTLKIATTKSHDFNVPNYPEMMDSLARWASPKLQGNTETGEPLAAIGEDGEEEPKDTSEPDDF